MYEIIFYLADFRYYKFNLNNKLFVQTLYQKLPIFIN